MSTTVHILYVHIVYGSTKSPREIGTYASVTAATGVPTSFLASVIVTYYFAYFSRPQLTFLLAPSPSLQIIRSVQHIDLIVRNSILDKKTPQHPWENIDWVRSKTWENQNPWFRLRELALCPAPEYSSRSFHEYHRKVPGLVFIVRDRTCLRLLSPLFASVYITIAF